MKTVDRQIQQLARKLGIPISDRRIDGTYAFDGRSIAMRTYRGEIRWTSDIVHDIAHYLVASKKRRLLPEFGLGLSPDGRAKSIVPVVTQGFAQREEERASILGILIEKHMGFDWQDTWLDHGWGAGLYTNAVRWFNDYITGNVQKEDKGHCVIKYLINHQYINNDLKIND
jgi:hypothetical protein